MPLFRARGPRFGPPRLLVFIPVDEIGPFPDPTVKLGVRELLELATHVGASVVAGCAELLRGWVTGFEVVGPVSV